MLQDHPKTRKKKGIVAHDIHQHLWRHDRKAILVMLGFITVQFFFMSYVVDASELTIKALLDCTNQIRLSYHLPNELVLNKQLTQAAENKLQDMSQYKYWAHQNPVTGKQPWDFIDAVGYNYDTAGENLAYGFTDSQKICDAWAKSPKHLANIVNSTYQEIGFAVDKANLHQNEKGILVVQMFGSRDNFSPSSASQTQQLLQNPNCQNGQCPTNITPQVKGISATKTQNTADDSVYAPTSFLKTVTPYVIGVSFLCTILSALGISKFKKNKKKMKIFTTATVLFFMLTLVLFLIFFLSPTL